MLALAALLAEEGLLGATPAAGGKLGVHPMAPRPSHFPAKAKSVIWLFMNGGPSQVDTWDYKPELAKRDGQELAGFDKNTGFFTDQVGPLMKSPFKFAQHGQSGAWVSEIFPKMAEHVDEMAFIHSCFTLDQQPLARTVQDQHRHEPHGLSLRGRLGDVRPGHREPEPARLRRDVRHAGPRPAQGSRAKLGRRLSAGRVPGHGAQRPRRADQQPVPPRGHDRRSSSGRSSNCCDGSTAISRRRDEADLAARIESFELAYRMQMAAPDALNVDAEPAGTSASCTASTTPSARTLPSRC